MFKPNFICASWRSHQITGIILEQQSSSIALPTASSHKHWVNNILLSTIMKSFFANLVVAACAFHEGRAFTVRPSRPSKSISHQTCSPLPLRAATVGSSSSPRSDMAPKPRAPAANEDEMSIIRLELEQKYIALGHSPEYAAREVNYFLSDAERSAQYVEMRRIAMVRKNDDLGIEDFVQFAAAFLVGMVGSWLLNYWHSLQTTYPDGGLPWIS